LINSQSSHPVASGGPPTPQAEAPPPGPLQGLPQARATTGARAITARRAPGPPLPWARATSVPEGRLLFPSAVPGAGVVWGA
jgi:hypothetical protein